MNEKLLYTLDPYILSLLFKPESDEKALEIYQELNEGVNTVLKETIKGYLKENKFSDEDIEKIINTEDFSTLDSKFSPYLQNIILFNRVEDNTRTYLKLFYDQVLPKMSEEDKKSLNDYLTANEEAINEQKAVTMEGLQLMKDILVENGVSSYEELKEKLEKEGTANTTQSTAINLGGMATNPTIETPETLVTPVTPVTPINQEIPTVTETPVTSEQTINVMPVENPEQELSPIVNMALDSTVNNLQQSDQLLQTPVDLPQNTEEIKFTPMSEVQEVSQAQQEPVQNTIEASQAPVIEQVPQIEQIPDQIINPVQSVSPSNFINSATQQVPVPPMPEQNTELPELNPVNIDSGNMVNPINEQPMVQPVEVVQPMQEVQPIQVEQPIQTEQQQNQVEEPAPQLSAINRLDGLGINLDNPVGNTQQ